MTGQGTGVSALVGGDFEQWNLRVPTFVKEFLEKLAVAEGVKPQAYVLRILEAHVAEKRSHLAAIYQRDADRAAKTAAALDRQAAAAERKNEQSAATTATTIETQT